MYSGDTIFIKNKNEYLFKLKKNLAIISILLCCFGVNTKAHKVSTIEHFKDISKKVKTLSQQTGIKLYIESNKTRFLGYHSADGRVNGESLVIKSFVKNDDIVIDGGANIGDWSKEVVSHASCTIYAFEPAPDAFEILKEWAAPYKNIQCFNAALNDEEKELEINWYPNSGGSTFFHRPILNDVYHLSNKKISVSSTSIDSFCKKERIEHINFLKIDTEGAEALVIAGSKHLIKHHKIDFIQFEYGGTYRDAKITLKNIYNFLISNNYSIFRITTDGLIYIPHWSPHLENRVYSNYLAISNRLIV